MKSKMNKMLISSLLLSGSIFAQGASAGYVDAVVMDKHQGTIALIDCYVGAPLASKEYWLEVISDWLRK
jgi:hypothetical protein